MSMKWQGFNQWEKTLQMQLTLLIHRQQTDANYLVNEIML